MILFKIIGDNMCSAGVLEERLIFQYHTSPLNIAIFMSLKFKNSYLVTKESKFKLLIGRAFDF